MHKQDIIISIRKNETALRSLGLKSLALFGSVVRNEQRIDSDIDVLYEFEEDAATLDRYVALQALLEDLLGRRVDLVSMKYLNPILRPYIEDDIEIIMQAIPQS